MAVPILPLTKADSDRFWSKVDRRAPDECWLWTAFKGRTGYGHFLLRGDVRRAHRIAWQLTHEDAGGLAVCHRCDNPACCNPAHLFVGTQAENVRDMISKGRQRHPRRTHCQRGHALTPDNLRIRRDGGRLCRTCDLRRAREYHARKARA